MVPSRAPTQSQRPGIQKVQQSPWRRHKELRQLLQRCHLPPHAGTSRVSQVSGVHHATQPLHSPGIFTLCHEAAICPRPQSQHDELQKVPIRLSPTAAAPLWIIGSAVALTWGARSAPPCTHAVRRCVAPRSPRATPATCCASSLPVHQQKAGRRSACRDALKDLCLKHTIYNSIASQPRWQSAL